MRYDEFLHNISESRSNEYFYGSEKHHIVPKCLGGSDDTNNLIYLTLREHFIAHKLLYEENPTNKSLFYAYWRMCNGKIESTTPEEYEEAKIIFASLNPMKGKHHTEESKRANAESHRRDNLSPEIRKKLSDSKIGTNNPMYGKASPMRGLNGENAPNYGYHFTEESKKKMSEAQIGEKNHMYGKHHSEETRKKMSAAWRNRKVSEDSRCKMSESRKSAMYTVTCKYCGQKFSSKSGRANCCEDCR